MFTECYRVLQSDIRYTCFIGVKVQEWKVIHPRAT